MAVGPIAVHALTATVTPTAGGEAIVSLIIP